MISCLLMAAAFEKIALIDSLDFASVMDIETREGTVELLDHVELSHPTTIWWRDKGGGRVRYPSKSELTPFSETPFEKRRLPREDVYGWLRMDSGVEIYPIVKEECARRKLRFGIHTTWEENHWCAELVSNWTLRHPQYWSCKRGALPWMGMCSIAYPEVVAHKLETLEERFAFGGDTIFLDLLRNGDWYPMREYVKPVTDEWRRLYACEPPQDWTDPRWLKLVGRHVNGYLRKFAAKCHERGVRFVLGIQRVKAGDDFAWAREFAVDWKGLAKDGTLDGIVVMNVYPDWKDPWGSTRRIYEDVMANRGKAKVYFPVSMYDYAHNGIPSYAKETGLSRGEVAKRLYDLAWDVGGAGVVLECVDHMNYPKDVNAVLADEREAKPADAQPSLAGETPIAVGVNTAVSLDGEWTLDYWPQPERGAVRTLEIPAHRTVAATVPGNCELDLERAGVLPDLTVGLNVLKLRPYEAYQWLYTKAFPARAVSGEDGSKAELVFGGIDTLADIFLNGEKIGESSNMFIERRLDVTGKLKDGENVVQVLLRPVMLDARTAVVGELGGICEPGGDGERYRKAAHMGGWDILPRAFVQGLWRPVRLEVSDPVRIREPVWMVKNLDVGKRRAEMKWRARVEAPFAALDVSKVRISLSRGGKSVLTETRPLIGYHPVIDFVLEDADLWWPRGFGEPALYEAKSEIVGEDGRVLVSDSRRIGIRTIELVREDVYGPDRPGQFLFKVNGEPCYIRGSNWVPLDALHGRDAQHLVKTLEMFEDLNCNMVRVWGGGVYESDAFFDWCDGHGLMVWQDFMTGCGVFPQDDDYARATREEVLSTVIRLRNHPALALWSGNNENDCAFNWFVGRKLARNPNLDRNSRRTIPDVLFEYDVTRPYLPSSPYYSPDVVAGLAKPSEDHLWGERAYYKVPFYTNSPCWFASEMGYHGCPNRASLERMMTRAAFYPWKSVTGKDPKRDFHWNDEWLIKSCNATLIADGMRHRDRNNLMTNHCMILFGECPTELDDFIWQSQFAQAEAMKTFVEIFRSRKFTRFNGLIWWNVRDGWPILSDAVVDYYGGKKRAYYAIRNSQYDQLVLVRDDRKVFAVNDTRRPVEGWAKVADRASGKALFERSYSVPANAAKEIGSVDWMGQGVLDIAYEQGGERHTNWFLYGEAPFDYRQVRSWFEGSDLR